MNTSVSRAQLLLERGRYAEAEKELYQGLANNPEDPHALSLLAICLPERGKYSEAVDHGRRAVSVDPEGAHTHYALGYALYRRDNHVRTERNILPDRTLCQEAEASVCEAIRLEPYSADFFSLLSSIRMSRNDWTGALEAAEQGLQIDPEDVECLNSRAAALRQLGRPEEARETLAAAMATDPENSYSQANAGWSWLQQGKVDKALECFKEALRISPENDNARAGMVEALKGRNIIYRVLLVYFLWMARLSNGARWGVIIGGYVLVRMLGSAARHNPEIRPYIFPIQILYAVFAILTWTAPHLFNLLLRLDKYGRYALSEDQKLGANCTGACLGGGVVLAVAGVLFRSLPILLAGIGMLALMVPVGGTFSREGRARRLLGIYTILLIAVGAVSVVMALMHAPAAGALGGLFVLGWVLFGWIANFVGAD